MEYCPKANLITKITTSLPNLRLNHDIGKVVLMCIKTLNVGVGYTISLRVYIDGRHVNQGDKQG